MTATSVVDFFLRLRRQLPQSSPTPSPMSDPDLDLPLIINFVVAFKSRYSHRRQLPSTSTEPSSVEFVVEDSNSSAIICLRLCCRHLPLLTTLSPSPAALLSCSSHASRFVIATAAPSSPEAPPPYHLFQPRCRASLLGSLPIRSLPHSNPHSLRLDHRLSPPTSSGLERREEKRRKG